MKVELTKENHNIEQWRACSPAGDETVEAFGRCGGCFAKMRAGGRVQDRVRPHCIQESSWNAEGTKCLLLAELNIFRDGPRGAGVAPRKNNSRRPPQKKTERAAHGNIGEGRRDSMCGKRKNTDVRLSHCTGKKVWVTLSSFCARHDEPSAARSDTELPIVMKSYKDLAHSAGCRCDDVDADIASCLFNSFLGAVRPSLCCARPSLSWKWCRLFGNNVIVHANVGVLCSVRCCLNCAKCSKVCACGEQESPQVVADSFQRVLMCSVHSVQESWTCR